MPFVAAVRPPVDASRPFGGHSGAGRRHPLAGRRRRASSIVLSHSSSCRSPTAK